MKKIYTVVTTLTAMNRKGQKTLLDTLTSQFAYRSRENAYKAVLDLKKAHIDNSDFEATRSDFELVKTDYGIGKYIINFEIKEYYLSDYEEVD